MVWGKLDLSTPIFGHHAVYISAVPTEGTKGRYVQKKRCTSPPFISDSQLSIDIDN
jgi:hypothetical protein